MNVLFVDDDDLTRECFGSLLAEEGFHVTMAANAREALATLEIDDIPFVLVTDLNFRSGMNGFDLITAVRRRQPALRAVLISGMNDVAVLHPSDLFLPKPFCTAQLVQLIEEAGKRSRAGLRTAEAV